MCLSALMMVLTVAEWVRTDQDFWVGQLRYAERLLGGMFIEGPSSLREGNGFQPSDGLAGSFIFA